MNTVASDARIHKVRVTKDEIVARLMDGRVLVPETCYAPGGTCDIPAGAGFESI
jgi:hypothetical protein